MWSWTQPSRSHLQLLLPSSPPPLSQEYQGSSVLGQFVTRFMLRETSSQLLSLQRSLQCAMEAVEEQSSPAPSVLHPDPSHFTSFMFMLQTPAYMSSCSETSTAFRTVSSMLTWNLPLEAHSHWGYWGEFPVLAFGFLLCWALFPDFLFGSICSVQCESKTNEGSN